AAAGSTWGTTAAGNTPPSGSAAVSERTPPVQTASLSQGDRTRFLQGAQSAAGSPADAASRFAVTPNNVASPAPQNTFVNSPGSSVQASPVINPYAGSQQALSGAMPVGANYANVVQSPAAQRWPGTSAIVTSELTNNTQVTLDYEVKKKGPSGVKTVEL